VRSCECSYSGKRRFFDQGGLDIERHAQGRGYPGDGFFREETRGTEERSTGSDHAWNYLPRAGGRERGGSLPSSDGGRACSDWRRGIAALQTDSGLLRQSADLPDFGFDRNGGARSSFSQEVRSEGRRHDLGARRHDRGKQRRRRYGQLHLPGEELTNAAYGACSRKTDAFEPRVRQGIRGQRAWPAFQVHLGLL